MINLNKLDPEVLGAVRQHMGANDEDDQSQDERIKVMNPVELFTHYLEWEGIMGYSATIWEAVESIKDAAGGKEGN